MDGLKGRRFEGRQKQYAVGWQLVAEIVHVVSESQLLGKLSDQCRDHSEKVISL